MAVTVLRFAFATLSLLLFLVVPATASAQSGQSVRQPRITDRIAANHFANGNSYFQVSRYEDAAREFQHAYDISHQPELLFNIGRAWESAGNIQASLDAYQRFDEAGSPGFDREILHARMETLRGRLPPPGQANASSSTNATVTPTNGTTTAAPAANATPSAPAARHTHTVHERSTLMSIGPIALLGLGVVVGGIGAALGVVGMSANTTYHNANTGMTPWSQEAAQARDSAGTNMTIGLTMGIVGGVLLLGGAAMMALRGPGEPHEVVDAFVTPLPGGGAMFGVGGRL